MTVDEFLPPVFAGKSDDRTGSPPFWAVDKRGPAGGGLRALRVQSVAFVAADAPTAETRSTVFGATVGKPSPFAVVARARPGGVTVTATICAAPREGQTATDTPRAGAKPCSFVLADPGTSTGPVEHDDAEFISTDSVPQKRQTDSNAVVSLTFRNCGTTTWTSAGGYRLASQLPADNTT